ncbi:hypothetical protein [Qipengyuania atrilutea]|nr:hypothetical protein [Actirhodobacter atriluteus]
MIEIEADEANAGAHSGRHRRCLDPRVPAADYQNIKYFHGRSLVN